MKVSEAKRLKDQGMSYVDIAREAGITPAEVSQAVRMYEKQQLKQQEAEDADRV